MRMSNKVYQHFDDQCGRILVLGFLSFGLSRAEAIQPVVSQFDMGEYTTATSTYSWAEAPANRHRLYLDVYNVTDFFDSETGGAVGFADHTQLADTIRPTATVLWDDRFRIQVGLIAEKAYGSNPGYDSVDPWLQLLWQPIQPLSVIFGDLDTPHYFLPAIFYPMNYFEQNFDPANLPKIPQLASIPSNYFTQSTNETGAQLILKKPNIYDDFFFNYENQDIPTHNEKFALGFVHRNTFWKWLSLNYQAHWLHYGGENNPHPIETRNDVAQAVGIGIACHPFDTPSFTIGGRYTYLHSHLRQEAGAPADNIPRTNGHGRLLEAIARWGRVKLIYGSYRGDGYYHEGGDPMFILPVVRMGTLRWDILLAQDFNLYLETTEYFIGNNNLGYNHDIKSAIHVQASWQFSIPIMEWTSPAASSEGAPIPARWDYGI
jgi:hypothetical protein